MRSIAALAVLLVLGCEGPTGPAGAPGEMGKRGGEGADGKPGTSGVDGTDGADGEDGVRGLPGARGPAGDTGPRGPAGPAGADADGGAGRGYGPGLWIACSRAIDLIDAGAFAPGHDGVNESFFSYRVTAYVGQDVDVQCEVAFGAVETASSGGYYPATTVGASTAACSPAIDYPPTGTSGGYWKFEIVAGTPQTKYHDADPGTLDGHTETFGESECTVLTNDGGGWVASTLADVF